MNCSWPVIHLPSVVSSFVEGKYYQLFLTSDTLVLSEDFCWVFCCSVSLWHVTGTRRTLLLLWLEWLTIQSRIQVNNESCLNKQNHPGCLITMSCISTQHLYQGRIQDLPKEGAPTLQGATTYDFAKFCEKLYEIENILDRGGGALRVTPLDPPLSTQTLDHEGSTAIERGLLLFSSQYHWFKGSIRVVMLHSRIHKVTRFLPLMA